MLQSQHFLPTQGLVTPMAVPLLPTPGRHLFRLSNGYAVRPIPRSPLVSLRCCSCCCRCLHIQCPCLCCRCCSIPRAPSSRFSRRHASGSPSPDRQSDHLKTNSSSAAGGDEAGHGCCSGVSFPVMDPTCEKNSTLPPGPAGLIARLRLRWLMWRRRMSFMSSNRVACSRWCFISSSRCC